MATFIERPDAEDDDEFAVVYGSMKMLDALEMLQETLNQIRANRLLQGTGAVLRTADITLKTVAKVEATGSITILVVTLAGSAARATTQTVTMSLTPQEPIKGLLDTKKPVVDSLVSLTAELAETVRTARASTATALDLAKGSITVDLVVTRGGSIEVATPAAWKTILKAIGFDAKASAAGELVSTSTIALTFGQEHADEDSPEAR